MAACERVSRGVKEGASTTRPAREEGELGGALEDQGGGVGQEGDGEDESEEASDDLYDLRRGGGWEEAEPEESDGDLLAEEGCLSETLLDLE